MAVSMEKFTDFCNMPPPVWDGSEVEYPVAFHANELRLHCLGALKIFEAAAQIGAEVVNDDHGMTTMHWLCQRKGINIKHPFTVTRSTQQHDVFLVEPV